MRRDTSLGSLGSGEGRAGVLTSRGGAQWTKASRGIS